MTEHDVRAEQARREERLARAEMHARLSTCRTDEEREQARLNWAVGMFERHWTPGEDGDDLAIELGYRDEEPKAVSAADWEAEHEYERVPWWMPMTAWAERHPTWATLLIVGLIVGAVIAAPPVADYVSRRIGP